MSIAKHLQVDGHVEQFMARFLFWLRRYSCDICTEYCFTTLLFIDWDLNEFTVCNVCYEKLIYHKLQSRKRKPYYHRKKEIARKLGVPFD